jgi:hypothetical protein
LFWAVPSDIEFVQFTGMLETFRRQEIWTSSPSRKSGGALALLVICHDRKQA